MLLFSLTVFAGGNGSTYYGNPYIYSSGTYGPTEWNSDITIPTGANVTISSLQIDGGTITIQNGATLTVQSSTAFNGQTNLAGKLTIQGTITANQPGNFVLSGCATLYTTNFDNGAGDPGPVSGTGFISISGKYSGQGNQFTASTTILIQYAGSNMTGPDNDGKTPIVPNKSQVSANATPACTDLPITLMAWNATVDPNDSTLIHFSWTTGMEQNVNYFEIQGSADGVTYETLQTVYSTNHDGNSSTPTGYTGYNFYDPLVAVVVEAGFGLFGSLLIIGLLVGFVSKKHRVIGAVCGVILLICMVSCTKYVNNVQPKSRKYKFFRLMEVDNSNTTLPTYSNVIYIGK